MGITGVLEYVRVNVPSCDVWIATVPVVELYVQLVIAVPSFSIDIGLLGTSTTTRCGPCPMAWNCSWFWLFVRIVMELTVELNAMKPLCWPASGSSCSRRLEGVDVSVLLSTLYPSYYA